MSVFNPENQKSAIENKIVAGMERLTQVFRTLLWEKAKEQHLSPIQIQLLIFIRYHHSDKNTISYLAEEFNVTKPTISDAVKVLEQKKLITKSENQLDSRSYSVILTGSGKKLVRQTEHYTAPISSWIIQMEQGEKESLWKSISDLIRVLNQSGAIGVQRTCYNCRHYTMKGGVHFCNLLDETLENKDIRIDCAEHELAG